MFLGHVALGLAAKRAAPGTSLGILVLAAQLPDTVWPVFVALGVERIGTWAFASLTVFLVVVYLAVILGPPPPSVGAVWVSGLAGAVLLTAWAWWADRHRVSRRV